MRMIRIGLFAFLVLWLTTQAFAQGGATGAINGTVEDPSGALVPGAEVKIINQDTGVVVRSVKTDADGVFAAVLLPVGTYTLDVVSAAFQEEKFANVVVRVTETARVTAKLRA